MGQSAIVSRKNELNLGDDVIESRTMWETTDDAELEDAVDAVRNARIVIMNPPFTERVKMGEKFPEGIQQALRARADTMERILVQNDQAMDDFVERRTIRPLFTALADRCVQPENGIVTTVIPTIALSNTSGQQERKNTRATVPYLQHSYLSPAESTKHEVKTLTSMKASLLPNGMREINLLHDSFNSTKCLLTKAKLPISTNA